MIFEAGFFYDFSICNIKELLYITEKSNIACFLCDVSRNQTVHKKENMLRIHFIMILLSYIKLNYSGNNNLH